MLYGCRISITKTWVFGMASRKNSKVGHVVLSVLISSTFLLVFVDKGLVELEAGGLGFDV